MRAGIAIAVVMAAALGGCGHKDLKAPCARDEGPPLVKMTYSSLGGAQAPKDACGPMRPIIEPGRGAAR